MNRNTECISEKHYCFNCPGCDEDILVDEGVRDDLLAVGCYLCGTSVDESDFRRCGDE